MSHPYIMQDPVSFLSEIAGVSIVEDSTAVYLTVAEKTILIGLHTEKQINEKFPISIYDRKYRDGKVFVSVRKPKENNRWLKTPSSNGFY